MQISCQHDKRNKERKIIMGVKGYIMQAQPFSVNDGEGIRTTIFMAGCPLRCKWCSNPEGFSQKPLVGWYERKCIGCGACTKVCPQGIGINMNLERDKCIGCGACVDVCPKGARSRLVTFRDADEVIAEVKKHSIFYQYSGGGVTFSGGEATAQPELLDYLTSKLYDMGYSLDIETCGYFKFESVKKSLERMDLIFMDLKHMDPDVHRQYTGVSNARTLKNIQNLNLVPADVVIRIPVIGGVNDSEENIRKSAAFVHKNLPKAKMELLPYHKFGTIKYEALGMELPSADFYRPTPEAMQKLKEIIVSEGVKIADYR